jgi:hypothetical protein
LWRPLERRVTRRGRARDPTSPVVGQQLRVRPDHEREHAEPVDVGMLSDHLTGRLGAALYGGPTSSRIASSIALRSGLRHGFRAEEFGAVPELAEFSPMLPERHLFHTRARPLTHHRSREGHGRSLPISQMILLMLRTQPFVLGLSLCLGHIGASTDAEIAKNARHPGCANAGQNDCPVSHDRGSLRPFPVWVWVSLPELEPDRTPHPPPKKGEG